MQGKIAEEVFQNLEKGFKPKIGIQTSDRVRYVDNILDGTAREIKSGRVKLTNDFKRQIKKDLEIITQQRSLDIQKIEWHTLGGIDDNALQYIRTEMYKMEVQPNLFKVIVY